MLKPESAVEYQRMTLGEYLKKGGYSRAFIQNYLLPMCAAVWSVPNNQVGCCSGAPLSCHASASNEDPRSCRECQF